jgi:2,4-dienoyl-CoA reductase (NADPH2)
VLEEGPSLAPEMAHPRRWRVLEDLRTAGATLRTDAAVESIADDAVHYRIGDETSSVAADHVVVATGLVADESVADRFRDAGLDPVVIGDCTGVGYLEGAIREGFHAGASLG